MNIHKTYFSANSLLCMPNIICQVYAYMCPMNVGTSWHQLECIIWSYVWSYNTRDMLETLASFKEQQEYSLYSEHAREPAKVVTVQSKLSEWTRSADCVQTMHK